MAQLIRFWFDLCLLRAAPQDMPASGPVLGVSVCCYALVSVLLATLDSGFPDGVQVALLDLLLLVLFAAGLLTLLKRPARINQTLTALTGSGSLLGLPALLLILLAGPDPAAPLPSTAWLLLLFWNLLVNAHILRHALSCSLLAGLGISVLYLVITLQMFVLVLPK